MRRLRTLAVAAAIGLVLGALLAAGGGGDDGYKVRAVFDNASFVIPGEDVKVAGVKVGSIDDVDLTKDNRAVVVLRIDDPAFRPFRRDAHCQIRLQSLIGEQYVECEPTRPRDENERPAPELPEIASGPGEGQHLLPVQNTTTPIAVDLITNMNRLPARERLRLIINELGAGLAGNGPRLRAAVRRANPALRELNEVIAVLARQDRLLARLVDESDAVLGPMAARRKELAGFIDHAGGTAAAAAERGEDLERNFERLPAFLRELEPTANRLTAMADQMGPAVATLESQAPAINETVERLGPFAEAATPALESLGDFADRGRELFPAIRPLARDLRDLARPLRGSTTELAALGTSFDRSGGIEELMRFLYFYTGSVNGVDERGHYLRSGLNIIGTCAARATSSGAGCMSEFLRPGDPAYDARAAGQVDPGLEYLLGSEDPE